MKICLQIPKNNKYIIACSFGPDSMALLDAAVKEEFDIVVAHVNYHHREASNYEETELRKYCKKHNLKIEILDLLKVKPEGNFEAWAREIRYEFFNKVLKKNKAQAVLVGHHQDDLIETYLMQKKRANYVKNWGIAEKTTIFGARIIRPLLQYTKAELLNYCEENSVPFSIDITNLSDDYERNKIRHSIIEKLTPQKRTEILKEIEAKAKAKIVPQNKWSTKDFSRLTYEDIIEIFDHYMTSKKEHRNISKMFTEEIRKFALSKKANCELKITEKLLLAKAYDTVCLVDTEKLTNYNLTLLKPGTISNKFLCIKTLVDSSDRNIKQEDYPLTIRNAKPNDKIVIKNHLIEARRLFIDWKMPLYVRKVWPVVKNKDGKIIYIPRYREKFEDNHKTKFEIDLNHFLAD